MRFRNEIGLLLLILIAFFPKNSFSQMSEDDLLRQIAPTAVEGGPPGEGQKGDMEEPFRVTADATVTLNYVFAESPDSFVVTYKIHLEGHPHNKVDVIHGTGTVTTEVKGYLAKWPTGECALKISIGEVPYEMVFSKIGDEQIHLDIKFTQPISENWESNCKFLDAPGSKFNTRGTSEKWVDGALKRAFPSLQDLQVPIDRLHKNETSLEVAIEQYLLPDAPLGSIELSGKGKITVSPE